MLNRINTEKYLKLINRKTLYAKEKQKNRQKGYNSTFRKLRIKSIGKEILQILTKEEVERE